MAGLVADPRCWQLELYLHGGEQFIPQPTAKSSHRVARGLRILLGKEGALHLRRVMHARILRGSQKT
jgi:hypothetical protein